MKIGDFVWFYGAYRSFDPSTEIIGENGRSWLVDGYKIPKNPGNDAENIGNYRVIKVSNYGTTHVKVFLSKESYDNQIWVDKNRSKIADAVKQADLRTLKEIAALLNLSL